MPNSETPDLVFTAEASMIIGVDVRTIHRWVDSGKLPTAVAPTRAGKSAPYVFHRADVLQARADRITKYLGAGAVA